MAKNPEESWRHLPLVTPDRAEAARQEARELEALSGKRRGQRFGYYLKKTGPGWMQSAMTLGGGSAIASLSLGASFGFELLWVQPLAMLAGIVMLAAHAHQTLSTGERPFQAMRQHVHPVLAWMWVIATLASTLVWDFPQFALAAGMVEDMVQASTGWRPAESGRPLYLLGISVLLFAGCTGVVWNYNRGLWGIRFFDHFLKGLIWLILVCFLVVIVRAAFAGSIDWLALLRGFLPTSIPRDSYGVTAVMAAFGSAVGINMTFLFGYSLLARGWGREHRGLAQFDLLTGMFVPYVLATSLMVVATAITLHGVVPYGARISPVQAAETIAATGAGLFFGRILFGLGIFGMAVSTIILHMLVCGFALCEIFKWPATGWKYRLACLLPAPAVTGALFWPALKTYVALPTSAICGVLLPIAYVGWFLLHNSSSFLGEDRPRGAKAFLWNIGMLTAVLLAAASSLYYLSSHL
jgi:Mn2+/Fe2+ NRAMP family transporter